MDLTDQIIQWTSLISDHHGPNDVDSSNHADHDVDEHDDDEHDDGQDAWDDIGEGARQWAGLESCFKTGKLLRLGESII